MSQRLFLYESQSEDGDSDGSRVPGGQGSRAATPLYKSEISVQLLNRNVGPALSDDEDEWEVASEVPITSDMEGSRSGASTPLRGNGVETERVTLSPPSLRFKSSDSEEPPQLLPAACDPPRHPHRQGSDRGGNVNSVAFRTHRQRDVGPQFQERLRQADILLEDL